MLLRLLINFLYYQKTNQFGFKEGGRLLWKIKAKDNSLIIKIKPLE